MRKTKMFYGNQFIGAFKCDGRKYSRIGYQIMLAKRMAQKSLIAASVLVIGGWLVTAGIFIARTTIEPNTVYAKDNTMYILNSKIDSLKDDVVAQLMSCESGGHKEEDGIIIFDSNNKASIGQAQFQVNTVIHYSKLLYGKTVTRKEAVLIAIDKDRAAQLTKDIMFKTKNMAGKDWVNCNKKLGLDAQILMIKRLEK